MMACATIALCEVPATFDLAEEVIASAACASKMRPASDAIEIVSGYDV